MPQDTRTALLDCAEHAARARGIDGFSYADLAEAVGIRKASIHYHFPTKADLSSALMERYRVEVERACASMETRHETGAGRLEALIRFYRAALNGGKTLCLCVAFSASPESLSEDVISEIRAFRAMMAAWITAVFELGAKDGSIADVTDPVQEARAMLALLEGAHLGARACGDAGVFDEAMERVRSRCR
jgi:TetR/AcrR family transcriptional repressor of nem operon